MIKTWRSSKRHIITENAAVKDRKYLESSKRKFTFQGIRLTAVILNSNTGGQKALPNTQNALRKKILI